MNDTTEDKAKSQEWDIDDECTELVIRTRVGGGRSYYVRRGRRYIGHEKHFTIDEARNLALLRAPQYEPPKPRPLNRRLTVQAAIAAYLPKTTEAARWGAARNLFSRYVLSHLGSYPLVKVRRVEWLRICDKAASEKFSRGERLHRELRAFLNWGVNRGVLEANPLSRSSLSVTRPSIQVSLKISDLVSIWNAAQRIGTPWSAMTGLAILTGEPITAIRQLQLGQLDLTRREITFARSDSDFTRERIVKLSPLAISLFEPIAGTTKYLFPSPRRGLSRTPINFYSEALDKIRSLADVTGRWSLRDIRRSSRSAIAKFGDGSDAYIRWSDQFDTERRRKFESEAEVVL